MFSYCDHTYEGRFLGLPCPFCKEPIVGYDPIDIDDILGSPPDPTVREPVFQYDVHATGSTSNV